jgi:hypothetical protein
MAIDAGPPEGTGACASPMARRRGVWAVARALGEEGNGGIIYFF